MGRKLGRDVEEGITSVNEPQMGSEHLIKQILKARIQIKGLRAAKITITKP